jgi:hypothetical protein
MCPEITTWVKQFKKLRGGREAEDEQRRLFSFCKMRPQHRVGDAGWTPGPKARTIHARVGCYCKTRSSLF